MGGRRGGPHGGYELGLSQELLPADSARPAQAPYRPDCPPAQPSAAGVVREAARLVRGHSASPSRELNTQKGARAQG
jgi:hypothetical protein